MKYKKIEILLKTNICLEQVFVSGENNHINVIVIGDVFIGMNQVNRQKLVYEPLMKYFSDEKIHSINIEAYSLKEWKKNKLLK
ncbi:BolA family protein [Buchnera aphidicola]|uniref:BolA/IbaG family iron-sulfur metabolism protein n=1 Tax=Buchnera aphidicola (Anoecia oenotherae) TaxID=1241833 RepID=A0A4D6XPZ0_9GAMM|nr:BolA/IbaG family iron-sulfur metabolism protein [Buchnera aphidicola]QCI19422.1 BolA/IbaG family iron-sulfur metabolism protein [Buchnera aphidicola (Anoecia oenotherae)]